jgi:hypothetical protein
LDAVHIVRRDLRLWSFTGSVPHWPNDIKLSDTPERRGLCRCVEKWWRCAAQTVTRRRVRCSAVLGALWPLAVVRIWIRLVADRPANSERPHRQQNQSALLLCIEAIKLNQSELRLNA